MRRRERGAALVEFAMTALVLYVLIAGGIELGRMVFLSQVLQDAARLAARELAVTPLPADIKFDCDPNTPLDFCALNQDVVLQRIWNPNLLVIDLDCYASDADLQRYLRSLPLVNQALEPALISETVDPGAVTQRRFLRYPGALEDAAAPAQPCPVEYESGTGLNGTGNPTDKAVKVYRVSYPAGVETVEEIPVIGEVRTESANPQCAPWGPFSVVPFPDEPMAPCARAPSNGIAAIRINFPFQAAGLSAFRNAGFDANGAPNPNVGNVVESTDPGGAQPGTYTGPTGLGNQYAFARTVRPYRRLLTGQSMFRREVFE